MEIIHVKSNCFSKMEFSINGKMYSVVNDSASENHNNPKEIINSNARVD